METAPSAGLEVYNHESDRRALLALFNATGGAGWRNKTGWKDNSDDLSTWHGVSVKSGRVCAVIMGGGHGLKGSLPPDIWDLTELERLDFGSNYLQGDIPPIPKNRMLKLYFFNMGTNRLTGNLPDLHLLPSLRETYLDNNLFTGSLSENIGRCEKLKKLYLFSNKLEGNLPSSLGKLVHLEEFRISDNGFSGVIPEECANMAKLRKFKVERIKDLTKPGNARVRSAFNQWVHERRLEDDLAELSFTGSNVEYADDEGHYIGYNDIVYSKETHLGTDRLDYKHYAQALSGLFKTKGLDILPIAVGIYAPWGAGKSFLLNLLKSELKPDSPQKSLGVRLLRNCCCCVIGIVHKVRTSIAVVMVWALMMAFVRWLRRCKNNCFYPDDVESRGGGNAVNSKPQEFLLIDFNAWEFASSEVVWASLVAKIFDSVETHEAFGRGEVRAARVLRLLSSSDWNWCGVFTFYFVVAALGVIVVLLTSHIDIGVNIESASRWLFAILGIPGVLTVFKVLIQITLRGYLGPAQGVLRRAASRKQSIGESYRGFMSDVKEELETLFEIIGKHNRSKKNTITLIVIIDDLDRCPRDKIIQMLEAMHLLLEQPTAPMAVLLAVDPALILSAISKHLGEGSEDHVEGISKSKCLQYLDKIVHIPFCLPPIAKQERLVYLDSLLRAHDNSCPRMLERLKKLQENRDQGIQETPSVKMDDRDGRKISLLQRLPSSVDVLVLLQNWQGPEDPTEILKIFFAELDSIVADKYRSHSEQVQSCYKALETMNAMFNEELEKTRRYQGSPRNQSPSSFSHGGESKGDTEEDTPSILRPASPVESGANFRESVPAAILPETKITTTFTISKEENDCFRALFKTVVTTPRKMRRVVNVYILQRSLAQRTEGMRTLRKELVTWTILAEFWPVRLSCVVHAMRNMRMVGWKVPTIQSIYRHGNGEGRSVYEWISDHQDFCDVDFSEGSFARAIDNGAEITKDQVLTKGYLLDNSFNLNPAIVDTVEARMRGPS